MKSRLVTFALGWFATTGALPAAPFVYESAQELHATGDFDGDGREDLLIMDKATGVYRIGYQLSAGAFTWVSPRASGVETVSGLAVGRFFNLNRDALALTAPVANRVNLLQAPNPAIEGFPISIFPYAVGPNTLAALDIGGAGNTAHHDLLVASAWNNTPGPNQLSRIRHNGAVFTDLPPNSIIAQPLARANRVKAKTTGPDLLGVVLRGTSSDGFGLYDFASGSAVTVASIAGLPTPVDYVHAAYAAGSPYSQFVFYRPGHSNLIVRPVLEPTPGTFAFGAPLIFELPNAIQQVIVLPGNADTRLLILFGAGESASVYTFNGVTAPALLQSFNAAAGQSFTGAAAFGGGAFMMFSGDSVSKRSAQFQNHSFNGSAYAAGSLGALPMVSEFSGRANVFYFQSEPFVAPVPNLLGSVRAGDFTSLFNQGLAQVTAETFGSSAAGLGNPTVTSLDSLPALTGAGLVSRSPYGAISMFSFAAPLGEEVVEVLLSPPPGIYPNSIGVNLSLSVPNPSNPIFYRKHPADNWTPYAPGTVLWLYQATTISCYVQLGAGPKKTAVRQASYKFAKPPEEMDSDGDGVPDFVEIEKGLDPKSGKDADGDSFSDLCEILSGTQPNNAASHPAAPCAQEATPADVVMGISFERQPGQFFPALEGTSVKAFDFNGSLLSSATTANLGVPSATDPAALLTVTADPDPRLVVAATEPHFELNIVATDKLVGRELLGVVPLPSVIGGVEVPYIYGGGVPVTEVGNWAAAAQAAYSAAASLTTVGDLDIYDTLVALVMEQKIQQIPLSRGFGDHTNITLFPFRANDAGRKNPSAALLLALEKETGVLPGFRLKDLYQSLQDAIAPSAPGPFAGPKSVVAEIYRINSLLNNTAPAGTYVPPVDALRLFLGTGNLPASYAAQSALTPAQLSAAFASVSDLLTLVPARPTASTTLVVRPDSFSGPCALFDMPGGASTMSLWHREGVPFHLLQAFALPPGSSIQVRGYTDIANLGCGADAIEVITLTLGTVPVPSPVDTDGDLLADELELLLFGTLGQNGSGDADMDGFSNLQEALDGTDPNNSASKGMMVVDLSPPALNLEVLPGGQLQLNFQFPPAYADKIQFGILTTPSLGTEFSPTSIIPVNLGGGNFQVILPNPGADAQFYLVYLGLK